MELQTKVFISVDLNGQLTFKLKLCHNQFPFCGGFIFLKEVSYALITKTV